MKNIMIQKAQRVFLILLSLSGQLIYGARKAAQSDPGYTEDIFEAIHLADPNALQYWINQGDIEVVDPEGDTPLLAAIEMEIIESEEFYIVELLVKQGANKEAVDQDGNTALLKAIALKEFDIVKLLVKQGANKEAVDSNGDTALLKAIAQGNLDIVKFLVKQGANKEAIDKDGDTALLSAVAYGNVDIVKLLVEQGANKEAVDSNGDTALLKAIVQGNLDIAEFLVEQGANKEAADKDGDTALLKAIAHDELAIVEFLVKQGANKEAKSKKGRTALLEAVEKRYLENVEFLVGQGADVRAVDNEGDDALTIAGQKRYNNIIKFFINYDAALINDNNAFIVLGAAVKAQDDSLIERLAQLGFDINTVNEQGETLLTQFVVNRDYDTVRFLIEQNINPYQVDKAGYSAFDYAKEDSAMQDILRTTHHVAPEKVVQEKPEDDVAKIVRRMQFIERTSRDIHAAPKQQEAEEEKKVAAQMQPMGAGEQQTQTYMHWNTLVPLQKIERCAHFELSELKKMAGLPEEEELEEDQESTLTYGDVIEKMYDKVLEDPLVAKVLAREAVASREGKYVFYRAEPGKYRVYRDFTDALYRLVNLYSDKNPFVFNRFFKDAAKEPTINEYIKPENARAHKIGPKELNVLLSANLALFGNVCNQGESTWYYFNENFEAPTGAVEVAAMFERIFDVYGFDKKYIPPLLAIHQGIMAQSATLQQIIVPRSIVDDVAMLSTYGYCFPWTEKVDEDSWDENAINYDFSLNQIQGRHTKISPILDKYKTGEIKIDDRWQARLLLNMLHGLNPKAGIEIYSYTRLPENMLNDLQVKVNNITAQIFKDWLEKERQNPHVPASIQEEPLGGVLQHLGKETARRRQVEQAEAALRAEPEQELIKEQEADWQEPMPINSFLRP